MVRWLMTWLESSLYSSVVYRLGRHRRVVLASGSFLWPLCRMDPDVNRHERRWMGVHAVCGQRNTDLGYSMVGLETMKGALGATTLFVRRVLLSGSLHDDGRCRQPGRQWTRSDGVHELLKTKGMTTEPRFQLQRTSRGWVRIKKNK